MVVVAQVSVDARRFQVKLDLAGRDNLVVGHAVEARGQ